MMTDNVDTSAEAVERLARWHNDEAGEWERGNCMSLRDEHLAAAALLRAVAAERDAWESRCLRADATIGEVCDERDAALARAARMRDALAFYAGDARWVPDRLGMSDAIADTGDRARTALAEDGA